MCISKLGMEPTRGCRRYQTGSSLANYVRLPSINALKKGSDLFNDKYTGKTTGGFVVYYVSGGKGDVTAFKPVSNDHEFHPSRELV